LFYQPTHRYSKAVLGEYTSDSLLKSFPSKEASIVVGIYKFRDQTGQCKASETGTFSTAVTQSDFHIN
jgi:curli production assembly/transport component CsgG